MQTRYENNELSKPVHVFHVGPDPAESGGISSVIASFLVMPINNIKIDYLVSWQKESFYGIALSLKVFFKLIKLRIYRRGRTSLHVHFGSFGSYAREGSILIFGQLLGFSTYATLHGGRMNRIKRVRLAKILLKILFLKTLGVYLLNPKLKDLYFSDNDRFKVVPNPLPFRVHAQPHLHRELSVLFAGIRNESKGLKILVEAWNEVCKAFPEWKLLVVGPKGDFSLQDNLVNVIDLGELPRNQVISLVEKVSIVCLPSFNEQSPMVIWEAMGKGTCVVATKVGAIPWILGDTYPYLCDPGDFLGLVRTLRRSMTANNHQITDYLINRAQIADPYNLSNFWKVEYRNYK